MTGNKEKDPTQGFYYRRLYVPFMESLAEAFPDLRGIPPHILRPAVFLLTLPDQILMRQERAELIKELEPSRIAQEAMIGASFKNILTSLPEELRDFERIFGHWPKAGFLQKRQLRETPAVISAWPESEGLIKRGLTPIVLFEAAASIGLLARRIRYETHPETVFISDNDAISEISVFVPCPPEKAHDMYNWLKAVSFYEQGIFDPKEIVLSQDETGLHLARYGNSDKYPWSNQSGE
jgi:hypothetical protein